MGDTELDQLSKMDRNPSQEDRYKQLLRQQGIPFEEVDGKAVVPFFGTGGNYSQTGDFRNAVAINQAMSMYKAMNEPVIKSLESSIPEITSKYAQTRGQLEAEKEPLETRYQHLLDEVTREGEESKEQMRLSVSREAGKRGILPSSGIYDQVMTENLRPINEYIASTKTGLGIEREDAIRKLNNIIANLTPEEVAQIRDVRNSIAQISAGAQANAIQYALQMRQQAIQQEQFEREMAYKDAALKMGQNISPMTLSSGQALIDPTTGEVIAAGGAYQQALAALAGATPVISGGAALGGGGGKYNTKPSEWTIEQKEDAKNTIYNITPVNQIQSQFGSLPNVNLFTSGGGLIPGLTWGA